MKKTITIVLFIFSVSLTGFSQKTVINSGGNRMKTFIDALDAKNDSG